MYKHSAVGSIKQFVLKPSVFFSWISENSMGLLPVLVFIFTGLSDLLVKTILFYKIGVNNVRSQIEWTAFGEAYFLQVINVHTGLILRCILLVGAIYLVGKYRRTVYPLPKLLGMIGYCFIPWVIGCFVLSIAYSMLPNIGVLNLQGNIEMQIMGFVANSKVYLLQRLVNFNAWIWTFVLGAAMLGVYLKMKFSKSLITLVMIVFAVIGFDVLCGKAVQYLFL